MVIEKHSQALEPYTLLRTALTLFDKSPAELEQQELKQVENQAQNEFAIESRVLNSKEAAAVIVPEKELLTALNEIKKRYEDEFSFLQDLEDNHLTEQSLRTALNRQCRVNHVLEQVASRSPDISDVEIGIYYHSHPEKFRRSEQREACHILLSINSDYPENTRDNSLKKIQEIAAILDRKPHKFSDLALKHSECPTAMHGGKLGVVEKGKLYPELDSALFKLKEGSISAILESEIGFHIVKCNKIFYAETISLKKATAKIKKVMEENQRRHCQRSWLASLPKPNT